MAKKKSNDEGLPYFKFFISKWSTGSIQQCSHASQGLFVNLCVLYWGQRGDLMLSKMQKRFPRKQKQFAELISEDVVKIIEDKIEISFLDEQLQELGYVSEQNRKNAITRWNQLKSDATALQPHSDGSANAMPKEEKRREEKREEEKREETAHANASDDIIQITEESLNFIDALCQYFSVKPITTSKIYNTITEYVTTVVSRNELLTAKIALENYKTYKSRSQEQIHNINKWMGSMDSHFNDGQWIMIDWEAKLKSISNAGTKRTLTETSPTPGTDYTERF